MLRCSIKSSIFPSDTCRSAVDFAAPADHPRRAVKASRERSAAHAVGAEGATAPETLRQKDREDMATLESRRIA
jgi:hypothetical protein